MRAPLTSRPAWPTRASTSRKPLTSAPTWLLPESIACSAGLQACPYGRPQGLRYIENWANPDLWVTCALGPYNFDFMDRVNREIVTKYAVDGVFANRWAPQGGDCFCAHCEANFKAASAGRSLPRTSDRRDPARRAFLEWRVARLTQLWKHWDASIRGLRSAARFIPNGPPDMKTAAELADIQFADYQARRGLVPPWGNGRRAKEFRAARGRRPVAGCAC